MADFEIIVERGLRGVQFPEAGTLYTLAKVECALCGWITHVHQWAGGRLSLAQTEEWLQRHYQTHHPDALPTTLA